MNSHPLLAALLLAPALLAQDMAPQARPVAPIAVLADQKTAPEVSRIPDVLQARPGGSGEVGGRTTPRSKSIDPRAPLSRSNGIDHSRVHYDEPGDGSLWVRGANYKLSFDAAGATYYPLFGQRQAQHHPHALSPDLVTADGAELGFERGAPAARGGDRIEIDRGSFIEAYDCQPRSIEQSFVFRSLPSRGDLVLRISIASGLVAAECDEAFEFRSELGRMTYGRATAIDGAGRRAAAPTILADGAITIRVDAGFLAQAELPLVIDPVVSTFEIDTSSFNNFLADVAYDASYDRWLVVYAEYAAGSDLDVYHVVLNNAGAFLWGGYINSNNASWWDPRCANLNSADQFLVACPVGDPGNMNIRGRTVQAGLSALSGEFAISSGESGWMAACVVGGDPYPTAPAWYCVVYERIYGVGDNDILVRLVSPSGVPTATNYLSNSGGTLDGAATVSRSNGGSTWVVAWERAGPVDGDIWAARIRYDGTVLNPPFQVTAGNLDNYPCVSSPLLGSQQTLLTFQRNYGTDYDIEGIVLDGATATVWRNLTILENVQVFQSQLHPFVDSDGQHFLFGYAERYSTSATDYDIYVSDLYLSGTTLGAVQVHQNLAYTGYREDFVRLASAQGSGGASRRYMAVWDKELSSTSHDILGALFDGYEGGASTQACFGDGTGTACPCGNNGAGGRGCASSVNPAGALLGVSGNKSTWIDTTVLAASGVPATSVCLFYQGTSLNGATPFGDGLNCTGGTVIRLGTKTAAGGNAAYPGAGDTPISVRGGVPLNGGMRAYQVWYRNSAVFCTSSTYNLTNGVRIDWAR